MARLINNKLLFIHCAKTGGTFFREMINSVGIPNIEVGAKHDSFNKIIKENPEMEFKECFGFVRHPVTWYRSRWAFAKMSFFKEKLQFNTEAQNHWMAKVWDDDLNQFIVNTLDQYPFGIASKYFNDMLGIFNGSNCVAHKYENLHDVIEQRIYQCSNTKWNVYEGVKRTLDSSHLHVSINPILKNEIMLREKELVSKFQYHIL
jgi:hypothetical protein